MKAKDYRRIGEQECAPYAGTLALTELVFDILVAVIGLFALIPYAGAPITTVIILLVMGPFNFSYVSINKEVKGKQKPKVEDLFLGFKRFSQAFVFELLKSIFIFLWSLLLIVPGIIKSYSYACAIYIAHDDPNMASNDAITASRKMMVGNKWKLFCLDISYIGWFLLCILTLGILSLWITPRHRQARYNFYLNLKNKTVTPEKEETK